jgi:hypothetical protein
MAIAVYALCALTSLACAVLLLRAWRRARVPLLFWSALGFVGFAVGNALMFTDFVILPDRDLSLLRAVTTFVSVSALLFGLLWEDR